MLLLLYLNTNFLPVSSYITATVTDFISAKNHGDQRCDNMKYYFSLIFLHTPHSNSAIPRDQSAPHDGNYCDHTLPAPFTCRKPRFSPPPSFIIPRTRKYVLYTIFCTTTFHKSRLHYCTTLFAIFIHLKAGNLARRQITKTSTLPSRILHRFPHRSRLTHTRSESCPPINRVPTIGWVISFHLFVYTISCTTRYLTIAYNNTVNYSFSPSFIHYNKSWVPTATNRPRARATTSFSYISS